VTDEVQAQEVSSLESGAAVVVTIFVAIGATV
jgi:hypothetical protein